MRCEHARGHVENGEYPGVEAISYVMYVLKNKKTLKKTELKSEDRNGKKMPFAMFICQRQINQNKDPRAGELTA